MNKKKLFFIKFEYWGYGMITFALMYLLVDFIS